MSLALALAAAALIIFMLVQLGMLPASLKEEVKPIMLQMVPGEKQAPTRGKTKTKIKQASRSGAPPKPTRAVTKTPPASAQAHVSHVPWNVIPLTSQEFVQSDIGSKPSRQVATSADAGAATGTGDGQDSSTDNGAGQGPGGEKLYNAEWYQKPSHMALASYMSGNPQPGSWGEVECKTIDRYHVEDCRELGESPGSGLARAMRQAAWQFLVRPPRVGGRAQIGAWVRIHWEITDKPTADDG